MLKRKNGFNLETKALVNKVVISARAEEEKQPNTEVETEQNKPSQETTVEATRNTQINYEDLIANARKQEKDKLYPTIANLEKENKNLVEKNNKHLLTIGEKDARIKELEGEINALKDSSNKTESEKEVELRKEIQKLNDTIADLKANTVSREDIENEIKAEYEVKLYRESKLRELGNTVIPELIIGNTKEEIDSSIEVSKQRYSEITNSILGNVNVPPANVNTSTFQTKDLKVEDLLDLNPNSPEYAQLRAKLGLR